MQRIPIEPQELANRHQAWLARDIDGYAYLHDSQPRLDVDEWWSRNSIRASDIYDIQWPEEQNWRYSLYKPEPEVLPCPRGTTAIVWESGGWWRAESARDLWPTLSVGYFPTRAQAIRAWNAVVREVTNDDAW
jgi:hypothetical protein